MRINGEHLIINIIDIAIYFLISSYFCFIAFFTILQNVYEYSDDIELISIYFFIAVYMTIFMYRENKKRYVPMFIPFIFVVTIFFIFNIIMFSSPFFVSIVSILISIVYAIESLQRIYTFNKNKNNFIKKYKILLNVSTFNPSFIKILMLFTIYYIIVYSIFWFFITRPIHYFVYSIPFYNAIIVFAGLFIISYLLYYIMLGKYKYVFILCSLSKHKEIPLTMLTNDFDEDVNHSKGNIQYWFNKNIGLYMNNVIVDTDKQVILFKENMENFVKSVNDNIDNTNMFFNYDELSIDNKIYNLDDSIKIIDDLMAMVVYKGTALTKILYDIKNSLEKIEYLRTDKKIYSKYIDNINEKYIPYVEYLVKTYLKNIDLVGDDVKDLQEKIILSLKSISEALEEIYESKFEIFKYNVENNIDVMDILLKQEGLIDNIKKKNVK